MSALRLVSTLALAAIFTAGTASAQQADRTVAKLIDIEGTVLVSEGDAMAAGAKDQRLKVDTRIVTTAGAKVTINYDNGCDVRLEENKRFVVRETGTCAALIAAVESIGAPVAAAGPATIGGLGLGILGAVAVGTAVAVGQTGGTNVSPN